MVCAVFKTEKKTEKERERMILQGKFFEEEEEK